MTYFMPDRSCVKRIFSKADPDDQLDLAWGEDTLSDGRPLYVEFWAQYGVSMLTYFFDIHGLENFTDADFGGLFEREGLIQWAGDKRHIAAVQIDDCRNRRILCVNVVIGEELEPSIARDSRAMLQYYNRSGAESPP
jgi:hypothetical protein